MGKLTLSSINSGSGPFFINVVFEKGGSTYFLSKMVGATTASKILLYGKDISAAEAFRLGIVDEVVPLKMIDQAALEKARLYAQIPTNYAVGVKKLINYDYQELACFLEVENGLLRKQVRPCKKKEQAA